MSDSMKKHSRRLTARSAANTLKAAGSLAPAMAGLGVGAATGNPLLVGAGLIAAGSSLYHAAKANSQNKRRKAIDRAIASKEGKTSMTSKVKKAAAKKSSGNGTVKAHGRRTKNGPSRVKAYTRKTK